MSDQSNETKRLVYAVLGFLDEEFRKPTTSADSRESLEVAMQCLETAFAVTIRDVGYKSPKSLREMYQTAAGGVPPFNLNLPASLTNLAAGRQTAPQNPAPQNPPAEEIDLGAPYVPSPLVAADIKKKADVCKDSGNTLMMSSHFEEALVAYTQAIELDGSNAVYFCNRAAAHIKLEGYDDALRDVQIALQLDPTYARAYGRMGVVHSNLDNYVKAYYCYKKANELEPSNESYENNFRISAEFMARGHLHVQAPSQFASVFQNPALMTMATQMLQDPAMQNMMLSLVSNIQTNGASGGIANTPGFDQLLQMGQAIAAQISDAYPADGADMSGRRPGNNQDPPQNDSYDL